MNLKHVYKNLAHVAIWECSRCMLVCYMNQILLIILVLHSSPFFISTLNTSRSSPCSVCISFSLSGALFAKHTHSVEITSIDLGLTVYVCCRYYLTEKGKETARDCLARSGLDGPAGPLTAAGHPAVVLSDAGSDEYDGSSPLIGINKVFCSCSMNFQITDYCTPTTL